MFDAGTSGLHALRLFEDCERAIVVDSVGYAHEVGRLHRLRPEDALPPGKPFSTHELGPNHLIRVLPLTLDVVPDLVMICAEIDSIQPFSDQLSAPVRRAVVQAIELIRREILGNSHDHRA